MSEYKLEFTLKQHTPLIHFQHEQKGATLRATEVKPKLDKYIISSKGGWNNIDESWKTKSGDSKIQALNYKIRIEPTGSVNFSDTYKLPNYFAEIDKNDDKSKKVLSTTKTLNVSIYVTDQILKKVIADALPRFWLLHNFGTRQNKGFGCFYLDEKDELFISPETLIPSPNFYILMPSQDNNYIWTVIKYYYQRLKSGINFNQTYVEPFLRNYLNAKWEKKWLKHNFLDLPEKADEDVKFWRFLLGMPYEFRFMESIEPRNPLKPKNWTVPDEILIKVSHPVINRFKSPITFKVYKNPDEINTTIFVILEDYPDETPRILKAIPEFTFSPSIGLRTKEQIDENRNIKTDKNGKVKYSKLKYIPSKDELMNPGEKRNFERTIDDATKFEKQMSYKKGYESLSGQNSRYLHFTKTKSSQTLPAPSPPVNFLPDLIQSYHNELLKKPIKVPLDNYSNKTIEIKVSPKP